MRVIFLIILGIGILNANLTKNGDVVSDSTTNLQWQDNNITSEMNWQEAIDYCEALLLDGGNWRLPNINELRSIVDDTRADPSINTTVFENNTYGYWSSTAQHTYKDMVVAVTFKYGNEYPYSKNNTSHVRCVRDGQ